eukprot:12431440-Karenia_brevis.AAC.1
MASPSGPASLGSSPLRTALHSKCELTDEVPRKRARATTADGRQQQMDSNTFPCLWCNTRARYNRSDRSNQPKVIALSQLGVNDKCKTLLQAKFSARSSLLCPKCKPIVCGFVESCKITDSPSKIKILRTLEAFVSRDDGSKEAVDSEGKHHPQVYQRRTCRILFNQDKKSRKLEKTISASLDDNATARHIAHVFSNASFSTKRSRVDDEEDAIVWAEPDDGEPCQDSRWFNYFRGFRNIGKFKALFCLYWLSTCARSETVRIECRHSLETHIIADWGTGRSLAEIGKDADPEGKLLEDLPMRQADSRGNASARRCTLLLIILYFSPYGDAILDVVLPHARSHRVWNYCILHMEFILCELRKACIVGRFKWYTHQVLPFPPEMVVVPDWVVPAAKEKQGSREKEKA